MSLPAGRARAARPREDGSISGGEPGEAEARVSSSDNIVRDIVRGLYEGRYVAGQRLVEPDLMRRYQVGRSTVREALKRLAAEGAVTLHAFRGAQIRHLSRDEAQNVLQILEMLVGLAARLAALNIDVPGASAYFTSAYRALAAFADERDSYELVLARNRFYRAMTRVGGNTELSRVLPSFQVHLIRTHLKGPQADRFAGYRRIAETILAGDCDGAEAAGRAHIRRILDTLHEAPDALFAPRQAAGFDFTSEDVLNV